MVFTSLGTQRFLEMYFRRSLRVEKRLLKSANIVQISTFVQVPPPNAIYVTLLCTCFTVSVRLFRIHLFLTKACEFCATKTDNVDLKKLRYSQILSTEKLFLDSSVTSQCRCCQPSFCCNWSDCH